MTADAIVLRGTEDARVRQGASTGTSAHRLRELAQDPAVTVRAAVAMNPACPPHVDQVVSRDPDERVRTLLARKLAQLLPSLTDREATQACVQMMGTLGHLVADAAVQVRAAIAECVKDMPDAPRDLILQLANDTSLPVCDPVIRLSPMLTDTDLVLLLTALPHPEAASSVASRHGLSAAVSDVIAASDDTAAVRALLSNRSAAIREATLDAIVGRAAPRPDWHAPLVARRGLSPHAARALSGFVADHLLNALAQRTDLGPVVSDLRTALAARLQPAPVVEDDMVASIRQLHTSGGLDEDALLDAARAGDQRRMTVLLAVASAVPIDAVERAGTLRNAKALVSLVWKAGFTMHAAEIVQAVLGQLGPGAILLPAEDGFPLSVDEMRWQLEVLDQRGR